MFKEKDNVNNVWGLQRIVYICSPNKLRLQGWGWKA